MKPAYLIAGTDEAKIARTRSRLRERAEREGGPGAWSCSRPGRAGARPTRTRCVNSLAAISLIASRRYLLVDGVEAWGKADAERVAEALGQIPPETTVALVAHGKAPAGLAKAVEAAGGELLVLRRAAASASCRSSWSPTPGSSASTWSPTRRRLLVERLGPRPVRLRTSSSAWRSGPGRGDRSASRISRR